MNSPAGIEHFVRYAAFSDTCAFKQNPLHALQRDSLLHNGNDALEDQQIRPIYTSQLQQLECLIRTQRNFQKLMKNNYSTLLKKYQNVQNELERIRAETDTISMNKLTREKLILERKYHEQMKIRLAIEGLLRALLQTLRNKCAALEKAQQQTLTVRSERDALRVELETARKQNDELRRRLAEISQSKPQRTDLGANTMNGNSPAKCSGFTPRILSVQRSLEVLNTAATTNGVDRRACSKLTTSMSKIDSITQSALANRRPVIPPDLLKSAMDSSFGNSDRSISDKQDRSLKSVEISVFATGSLPHPEKNRTTGGLISPVRLGTMHVVPETAWNQFDNDTRALVRGYLETIADTCGGTHFTSALCPASKSIPDSRNSSSASELKSGPKNDEHTPEQIKFYLGNLSWCSGCPPSPSELLSQCTNLPARISPQLMCSSPFELFLNLPQSFSLANSSSFIQSNQAINRPFHEEAQPTTSQRKQIVLSLDPITHVTLQCGISGAYVRRYLDALKSHAGLFLITNTGLLWTRKLLNSLAQLFSNDFNSGEGQLRRYTLTQGRSNIRGRSCSLLNWLVDQDLIQHVGQKSNEDKIEDNTAALLIFENMDFLRFEENVKTMSHLLGISPHGAEKSNWTLKTQKLFILGLSDSLPVRWLKESIPVKGDPGWRIWSGPVAAGSRSVLMHQLTLRRAPLMDVVPIQLRLAAHRYTSGIHVGSSNPANSNNSLPRAPPKSENSESCHPTPGEMFRWLESIWTRLFMYVKWLGLNRIQWLSLEPGSAFQLPLNSVITDSESLDTESAAPSLEELERNELASSLLTTQLDVTTERLISELLDPDLFLSCPGIEAALQDERFADISEVLRWIERNWNDVFEPGLQVCTLSAASLEVESENRGPTQTFLYLKTNDPNQTRGRVQQSSRQTGSDAAAAVFVRQIVMPDCPLQGHARLTFASHLVGGESILSRHTQSRRTVLDQADAIDISYDIRTPKSGVRTIDESLVHKRAQSERIRTKLKPNPFNKAHELSDDPTSIWGVSRTLVRPRFNRFVHTEENRFTGRTMQNHGKDNVSSSDGSDETVIHTPASSLRVNRRDLYSRCARLRAHAQRTKYPPEQSIGPTTHPLTDHTRLLNRLDVKLDGETH